MFCNYICVCMWLNLFRNYNDFYIIEMFIFYNDYYNNLCMSIIREFYM